MKTQLVLCGNYFIIVVSKTLDNIHGTHIHRERERARERESSFSWVCVLIALIKCMLVRIKSVMRFRCLPPVVKVVLYFTNNLKLC